ncbi:ABC transporter substrate-binding protein [Paenibacillus lemnae]|uniref:ABC transporter substrate-binding protein n=1 Tax=Paenibacillus lemnae TaxID=1330551 RepID=A0A848MDF0_PAELE|nr:ABC transporter substrate-binding protein [Paenibacillus lemnae]NMO98221.1 ABC transporter substrate-binding protein [Paenibacillus lemnae]
MRIWTRLCSIGLLSLFFGVGMQGCVLTDGGNGGGAGVGSSQTITIGYQSPTAETWGALIMKHEKLVEKYLKVVAPDDNVRVEWFDAPAGSVLNNNMIGGKVDLAFLGDMPSLLNGVEGITRDQYSSVLIALDGKGKSGKNQSVVVPLDSPIDSIEGLKGKTVSTPIGSSAHRMLLDTLRLHDLIDKVNIVDQSVTVGLQSVEQGKVDAHATWEPYPSLIEYRNAGKVLQSGEATNIDYLTGIVANRGWAEQHRDYVIAFLMALHEAHRYVVEHPKEAAAIFEAESKYPLAVCERMVESIRYDAAFYEKDIQTLNSSAVFLSEIGKLKKELDMDAFIDDSYLKEAMQALDKTYLTGEEISGDWISGKEL